VTLHSEHGCTLRNVSLAEVPIPRREPGFYLEPRLHHAWVQAHFIEHLREGMDNKQAAAEAGATASRMRSLGRRDSAFKALMNEAHSMYLEQHCDQIRRTMRERAFDKHDPQSARLLVLLAEIALPEMDYKRKNHVTHDNPLQVQAIPYIDPAKLDAMPIEDRELFADLLRRLTSEREQPPRLRAIDAGS